MNIYLNRCKFSFERLTFNESIFLSNSACDNCFESFVVESNVGSRSKSRSAVGFFASSKDWTQIYRTQGYLQNNMNKIDNLRV